jgi:hypothetical protein
MSSSNHFSLLATDNGPATDMITNAFSTTTTTTTTTEAVTFPPKTKEEQEDKFMPLHGKWISENKEKVLKIHSSTEYTPVFAMYVTPPHYLPQSPQTCTATNHFLGSVCAAAYFSSTACSRMPRERPMTP